MRLFGLIKNGVHPMDIFSRLKEAYNNKKSVCEINGVEICVAPICLPMIKDLLDTALSASKETMSGEEIDRLIQAIADKKGGVSASKEFFSRLFAFYQLDVQLPPPLTIKIL